MFDSKITSKAIPTLYPQFFAAKQAQSFMAKASSKEKNDLLQKIADKILLQKEHILAINQQEVAHAQANNISSALIDRLVLTAKKIEQIITSIQKVIDLPDPIGRKTSTDIRPNGLEISQMRSPIGVIAMIYEARPEVTIDAACLAIKSGNCIILRGGKEALQSNIAFAECISMALKECEFPNGCVQLIIQTDRHLVDEILQATGFIDVVIPRGGKGLVERISQHAKVPVIKHLDGICHVYVDEYANIENAVRISDNAKTQRYGTCNTLETLLIHEKVATVFLPQIAQIYHEKNVEIRGDVQTCSLLKQLNIPHILATQEDWQTEYLAPIISIAIVSSIDQAIKHIEQYGSHHTDSIITEDYSQTQKFIRQVDSASVMVNASTRFADGFEYGLGAEIGISTDKFHVRGPVGLDGLTTLKWVVMGQGQIRE